jgi:hypothetical protein
MKNAKPKFLNVDLHIESATNLDALSTAMGKRVFVLHSGLVPRGKRHVLVLEISILHKNPDATIQALCKVADTLSPATRRVWDAAQKEFDIGYELRTSERSSRFTLRTDTLQRIVNLGANVAVTYYRGEGSGDPSPASTKRIKS